MDAYSQLEISLKALLGAPQDAARYNDTGALLYALGDMENARKFFQKAYALNPASPDIVNNYAMILYNMAEWETCAVVFESLLFEEPENKEAARKLQHVRSMAGEYAACPGEGAK
jgi:Flp pilus assembly protein TadD